VNGSDGHVGNTHVFCITDAGKSLALEMVAQMAAAKRVKKPAKAPKKKVAKTGKKKPAKRKAKKKVKRISKGRRNKP
jgi:hypothetical protein